MLLACQWLAACQGARTPHEHELDGGAAPEAGLVPRDAEALSDASVDTSPDASANLDANLGASEAGTSDAAHSDAELEVDASDLRDAAEPDAREPDAAQDASTQDASTHEPDACAPDAIVRAAGEHACLHARNGPYVSVTLRDEALAGPGPDVDAAHTAYQLAWPSDSSLHGSVRYRALSAGTYVVFSAGARLTQVTPALTPASPLALQASDASRCALLPHAALVELQAGDRYDFRLARTQASPTMLVIEPLWPFAMPDRCMEGDDAGAPDPDPDPACRTEGPCTHDSECCLFCHDGDHCH